MIKDVIIDIKGDQVISEQTDTIEFTTDGKYGYKDGEYFISYDEGHLFDTGDLVKTKIFIKPNNTVLLQRNGTIKSKMFIEKRKRNTCFYTTPYGEMVIGIFGEDFNFNLSESGGEINLKYTIDSNLEIISHNNLNIKIREVRK